MPSDPATRAGRALAMQLLAVALARRDGLPAETQSSSGAFPDWLVDEPGAPARAAAEVALRRALLPEHPLAFVEPSLGRDAAATWHALVAALLPDAGDVELVLRAPAGTPRPTRRPTRAAAAVATALRAGRVRAGAVRTRPRTTRPGAVAAALATLDRARRARAGAPSWTSPWPWARRGLGADAVAERTERVRPALGRASALAA